MKKELLENIKQQKIENLTKQVILLNQLKEYNKKLSSFLELQFPPDHEVIILEKLEFLQSQYYEFYSINNYIEDFYKFQPNEVELICLNCQSKYHVSNNKVVENCPFCNSFNIQHHV
jgi:hypothetical protein